MKWTNNNIINNKITKTLVIVYSTGVACNIAYTVKDYLSKNSSINTQKESLISDMQAGRLGMMLRGSTRERAQRDRQIAHEEYDILTEQQKQVVNEFHDNLLNSYNSWIGYFNIDK